MINAPRAALADAQGMGARALTALDSAMDRYALGEDDAFLQVYAQLAPKMYALLQAYGCQRALAEDLMQQAFLRMHRARSRYKTGQEAGPWALSIVRRLLVDHWRRRQRELTRDPLPESPCERTDPESQAIAEQVSLRLTSALLRLPAPQRRAFELVRLDGLSLAEAASLVGTTVPGIKLRLHRACTTLRAATARDDVPQA